MRLWLREVCLRLELAADVGWSADLASSLRQQNNVALSAASPIDTNSAELRVDLNLWHKTEVRPVKLR